MNNVVSLKDHRMANPKEAILTLKGSHLVISSPDKRYTFLSKSISDMFEYNELIEDWKKKHPKCSCIDF